jgi:hypothetical protein
VKGAMGVEDITTLNERAPFGHVCTPDEGHDHERDQFPHLTSS